MCVRTGKKNINRKVLVRSGRLEGKTWKTLYGHVFVLRRLDPLWKANEEGNDIIIHSSGENTANCHM